MPTSFPLTTLLPQASRIIYGCMGFGGGWDSQPLTEADIAKAHAATETALEAGITVFDHADIYAQGKAEQCFGELFRRQPTLRGKVLLQSKCGIRFGEGPNGWDYGSARYDLSAAHILGSMDGILRRLGTEQIDILILHRPDPLLEPEEVAEAWRQIKAAGKARFLGVSNMHAAQMQWLASALDEPLALNQLEMSLLKLDWLDGAACFNSGHGLPAPAWPATLEHCQANRIQLQAWSPLAVGKFTGAAKPDAPAAVHATTQLVRELAQKHGVPPEAVVLAWLMRHPAQIQPVLGTTDPERIRSSCAASDVQLSREDWYRLYITARGKALP